MGHAKDLTSLGRGAAAAPVNECVEGGEVPECDPRDFRFFFVQFPPIPSR